MFGLSSRTTTLRIETLARNAVSRGPDTAGVVPKRRTIAADGPASLRLPAPAAHMLAAARQAQVRALLSRDASDYLCNYLCWRAAENATQRGGPRLAAFVHVPPPRGASAGAAVTRAATAILLALAGCLAGAQNRS
jgi:pyroglutamyl-peptidase